MQLGSPRRATRDINIAYQTMGHGPLDIVIVPGAIRIKLRRTQCKQMSSGLLSKADIARCSRDVSKAQLQKLRLAGNDALHRRVPDYLWQQ